jgi:hypothetical protein
MSCYSCRLVPFRMNLSVDPLYYSMDLFLEFAFDTVCIWDKVDPIYKITQSLQLGLPPNYTNTYDLNSSEAIDSISPREPVVSLSRLLSLNLDSLFGKRPPCRVFANYY